MINIKKDTSLRKRVCAINIYLLYLPLLVLYIAIILVFSRDAFQADEGTYIGFAKNLLHGFYSPPAPNINLWNGPGYPLILVPFAWLKLPLIFIKLLNSLFMYFSVILFYKTLELYIKSKKAVILYSFIFGLYYPFFSRLHLILTETFAILLICGFIYLLCRLFAEDKINFKKLILPSVLLGYLALTKIIFGYVILACLFFFTLLYIIKKLEKFKIMVIIYLLALLFCTPYLIYTYSVTDKIFYWGNSGGSSLYWMSTPHANELGSWHNSSLIETSALEKEHHKVFFDKLSNLSPIERDNALKKEAIKNIKNHPMKYFINGLANIGRMLFSYPYSNTYQKLSTYFYMLPSMFIFVLSVLFIYPTVKVRKKIPFEITMLLMFGAVYFGASSLLSAYARQFYIVVPIVGLWLVYMFNKLIIINYNFKDKL